MNFPQSAIFAFNANLDHVKYCTDSDLAAIEEFLPVLSGQISESFAYGMQKEVAIDMRALDFFLTKMKFDRTIVGGQAGNAAQQASALGVKCFVHSNFANEELAGKFNFPDKILLPNENGFIAASSFASHTKSAHHFVFENKETRIRFIASYDPFPMHPEDSFTHHITGELPSVSRAFVGGFHLLKTPDRMRKFLSEMKRWKEVQPKLEFFCELGEFQSSDVMDAVRSELLPFMGTVGATDSELAQMGVEPDELASETGAAVLFHTPEKQQVFPESKLNGAALEFAKRCASHKARAGKAATEADIAGESGAFVESPVQTVGLGDTFSCAYFMSA